MNLDAYDDMMGLEFGEYEGMGQFLSAEMLKEALIASTAGGGAILLTVYGVKKLSEQLDLANKIPNPIVRSAVTSAVTLLLGVAGGKALYEYNREAAMGVAAGLGGIAMANFIDAVIAQVTGNPRMLNTLGDSDMPYGGNMDGMAALAALETTGVTSAPGAFQGFADPTVTPEALMGFDGTVVQQETLGEMGYGGYLS
jgi:hypothetical protein